MFTGIVEEVGKVRYIQLNGNSGVLAVKERQYHVTLKNRWKQKTPNVYGKSNNKSNRNPWIQPKTKWNRQILSLKAIYQRRNAEFTSSERAAELCKCHQAKYLTRLVLGLMTK